MMFYITRSSTVEIKKLNLLSIATALKLFTIKVAPIATSGIQLIWKHLTYSNLKRLEGVKTALSEENAMHLKVYT